MKKLFKQFWLPVVGAMVGAVAGFLYWKFVGCTNGTCSITSKPANSTIYFALLGGLLFSMFQKKKAKDNIDNPA